MENLKNYLTNYKKYDIIYTESKEHQTTTPKHERKTI